MIDYMTFDVMLMDVLNVEIEIENTTNEQIHIYYSNFELYDSS